MILQNCTLLQEEAKLDEQLTLTARAALGTLLVMMCVMSLVLNVLFWVTILRYRRVQSMIIHLFLTLSASDIMESSTSVVFTTHSVVHGKLTFGCTTCKVMGFMTTLTAALALTSLTAMSINRYVRICNHDWYHVFYNKNNIVLHNLAIWIAACLWALSPLLGWGHFKYTHHMFFCSEEVDPDLLASRLVGISVFASMMVILICCYVAIFYRLSRPSEPSRSLTTHSASDPPTVKHVPPDWLYRPRLPLAGGRFMEKKLSAITEITDSDITNDLYSCSHKTTPASEPLSKEESSSSRNAVNIQVPCTQGLKTDRAVSRPSQEPIPENHASHTIESLTVTKEPSHDSVSSGCGSIESSVLGSGTSKERFYEKRLTLCIVFLTITFLVSYLPIFHFTVLNESTNMSSAFKVAFLLLTYGNNVINPILYCWGNCRLMKGYRMLYKDCLKQVCCKAKCSSQVNHG